MDIDKKPKSRAFYFFDKLFRMFICNLLCVASMAIPVAIFIFVSISIGGDGIVFNITNKEKVEYALNEVLVPSETGIDFEVPSLENYKWEVVEGSAIKFENVKDKTQKAVVTKGNNKETVKIKLTVQVGSHTDSKIFDVLVPAFNESYISVDEAFVKTSNLTGESSEEYFVQGFITKIVDERFGKMYIRTSNNSENQILIENLKTIDGIGDFKDLTDKPNVGDFITVCGKISKDGEVKIASAKLVEHYNVYEKIMPNEEKINSIMLLFAIGVGVFLLTFPFLILPSLVSATSVIKDTKSATNAFKAWGYGFKKYYVKSMLVGLIYSLVLGIVFFTLVFYSILPVLSDIQIIDHFGITSTGILFTFTMKAQEALLGAGYVVSLIFALAGICFVVHAPMVIITLPNLKVVDLLKTNVFMTINYFVNTIVLVAMLLVSVIGFFFFPIWIIFGISLPILIGLRFSKVNYHELEKVDFDKINKQVEIDIELEEEE